MLEIDCLVVVLRLKNARVRCDRSCRRPETQARHLKRAGEHGDWLIVREVKLTEMRLVLTRVALLRDEFLTLRPNPRHIPFAV